MARTKFGMLTLPLCHSLIRPEKFGVSFFQKRQPHFLKRVTVSEAAHKTLIQKAHWVSGSFMMGHDVNFRLKFSTNEAFAEVMATKSDFD